MRIIIELTEKEYVENGWQYNKLLMIEKILRNEANQISRAGGQNTFQSNVNLIIGKPITELNII